MDGIKRLAHYQEEERPWGKFERFTLNEPTTVKIITVNPEQSISLQTHDHREEFWRVIAGSGTIHVAGVDNHAVVGSMYYTPVHTDHRITAGPEGLVCLEIAFGDFDEKDIHRLEDRYGRA